MDRKTLMHGYKGSKRVRWQKFELSLEWQRPIVMMRHEGEPIEISLLELQKNLISKEDEPDTGQS